MKQNQSKNQAGSKIGAVITVLLIAFGMWYILLPSINLHSIPFWIYLIINLIIGITISLGFNLKNYKYYTIPGALIVIGLILIGISNPIINTKAYSNLIVKESGSFEDDIKEASFDQVPTVDRDTAQRLGSRKMGEMLDLVSQYNVANYYTQINYKNKPVRVTTLEYNGILKWLGNRKEGIPNYMIVDMIDGSVEVVKSEANIRYSKSDKFSRNIIRHVKMSYPLDMILKTEFEIDEEGKPYWISPVYKATIGWFGGLDVKQVILTNAITGEHEKYELEDVPKWVDRVFDASMIIQQLNWNGTLQSGYLNSRFAQKGVIETTEGYNYLAIDDDVYLYTGITSVASDESNIGFVLVNMRNKDTKFYQVSSAEEFSAMESAEGAVQEKGYRSTFPILLNINNKPTYFLSLKDDAGLVKMYALVDAQNYQQVTIGQTVSEIVKIHSGNKDIDEPIIVDELEEEKEEIVRDILELTGPIVEVESAVVDGDTHYYLIIEDKIFLANVNISEQLPFIKVGNNVSIEYYQDSGLNVITKIIVE